MLLPGATGWRAVGVSLPTPVLGVLAWRNRVLLVGCEGELVLTAVALPRSSKNPTSLAVRADTVCMLTKPPFVDARRIVEEHRFYLDELLHQEIRVRIYQPAGQQGYLFEASHDMSTPVQATRYKPNSGIYATTKEALESGARALATFYQSAIKAGHKPAENWLVPNDDY